MFYPIWTALRTKSVYFRHRSNSENEVKDKNIVQSFHWTLNSYTSPLLRFRILLSSKISNILPWRALLQYFGVTFSTLKANSKYTGRNCFSCWNVIWSRLVVVCNKQRKRTQFVSINKFFSVFRRFTVLLESTTEQIITCIARLFFSSVYLRSSFFIL